MVNMAHIMPAWHRHASVVVVSMLACRHQRVAQNTAAPMKYSIADLLAWL